MQEDNEGESIVVVPEKGADDKTMSCKKASKVNQLWSCQKEALMIKQMSCKKARKVK